MGLINFCKRKYRIGLLFLSYPQKILPQKEYKNPIDIDELNEHDNFVILRRSEKSEGETFDDFGNLRQEIILEKRIPGLSMNLLGGYFQIPHIKFHQTGDAGKEWDSKVVVRLKNYIKNVTVLETYCPIFFFIRDFQNLEFPYDRPNDSNAAKLLAALGTVPSKQKVVTFKGKTVITHKPTNLNYWHVELTIKEVIHGDSGDIVDPSSAWKKKLMQQIYHVISVKAMNNCPIVPQVQPEVFSTKDN